MSGVQAVFHPGTLHKPHVATHRRQDFVDTNIGGTLNLLEEAVIAGVESFVYTSTTSVCGDALVPPLEAPAAWITEEATPVPKNIYGVTKAAAEDLCQLFHRNQSLACIVLRTSRFFPDEDDNRREREAYSDANVKANEYLYRRVDIEDVVSAHLLAQNTHHQSVFANTSLVQLRHFALRISRICVLTRPEWCESASQIMKPNMSGGAGKCSRALDGCMSTSVLETSLVGCRDMTSTTL